MKKKILAGILGLSILLPTQAFANETVTFDKLDVPAGKVDLTELPLEHQNKLSERSKVIGSYFDELMNIRAEISSLEIEMSQQRNLGGISPYKLTHLNELNEKLNYYENNSLEIAGLVEIDPDSQDSLVQPFSSKDQVTVDKPKVYFDNDSKLYVGETNWRWTSNSDINNSGNDGIGITNTQETLSIFDFYVNTWDQKGNKYYNIGLNPETSSAGYHLEFNDSSNGATYRGHIGQSWFFFKFYNGTPVNKSVNFNTTYTHTYSGTLIDSVTVGWGTFSIGFIGSNKWDRKNEAAISF
ncbi:hypothetical protein ACIQZG_09735 [Lysinibacillus sp. NPDC096418]|uniref:hypothetical protein n=1 Tax=Lysinibacillus sp. NPDC096418 TaxID=3364138 RepID=UPI0037F9B6AB